MATEGKKEGKKVAHPDKCPRCARERWRTEELSMYGKHLFIGRGYRFRVFMCEDCGYSELYFKERATWL